jgi:hypothetical protein
MSIKIGSTIKSYDFNGNTECFIVGEVQSIDDDFYYCSVIKTVFDSKEIKIKSPTFRCLKQGLLMNDSDSFPRITLL